MRVLLTTPSSRERLHNLVPLGWALRAAGHAVQVAARPGFSATVNRTGLVAVAAGEELPAGGDGAAWLADPPAVDMLADYVGLWPPDLVIWDQFAPAGAVAAWLAGAASVRMRSLADHFGPAPADVEAEAGRRLGDCLERYGLTPHDGLVCGQVTVDPTPPSMRVLPMAGCLPVRHVPYDGPGVIPAWLRRRPRRPRLYVTLPAATPAVRVLFEAVATLDIDVICVMAVDGIPPGTTLPDNVRLLDAVPLTAALPTCSAVVHDGTVCAAAVGLGLPQLRLTAEAGDGPAALARRVDLLMTDPTVRQEAERLREEVWAMPSPRDVVPELEKLAAPAVVGRSVSR